MAAILRKIGHGSKATLNMTKEYKLSSTTTPIGLNLKTVKSKEIEFPDIATHQNKPQDSVEQLIASFSAADEKLVIAIGDPEAKEMSEILQQTAGGKILLNTCFLKKNDVTMTEVVSSDEVEVRRESPMTSRYPIVSHYVITAKTPSELLFSRLDVEIRSTDDESQVILQKTFFLF